MRVEFINPNRATSPDVVTVCLDDRSLIVPRQKRIAGVAGDANVGSIRFRFSGTTSAFSLDTATIYVDWIRSDNEGGSYIADLEKNGFVWKLSPAVTAFAGSVAFALRIEDGQTVWRSRAGLITIEESLGTIEAVAQDDPKYDVITQLLAKMQEAQASVSSDLETANALNDANANAKTNLASLETANGTAASNIESLTELNTNAGTLEASLTTLNSDAGKHETSLTTINNTATALKESLPDINTTAEGLKSDLTTLNAEATGLKTDLTPLNESLTTLTGTGTALEESLTELNAEASDYISTLSAATTEKDGFLVASDKAKLDNLPDDANQALNVIMQMVEGMAAALHTDVQTQWRHTGAFVYLRSGYKMVAGPYGPVADGDGDAPFLVLEFDGTDTLSATVYQQDEDGDIKELPDEEIFPFGCLKWYLNPDFTDPTTKCILTKNGVADTARTMTISDLNEGSIVVCRLEY